MEQERSPKRDRFRAALLLALLRLAPACQHASDSGPEENAELIFAKVCARCHGSDGSGGVAPEGTNAPRNFKDHAFQTSRTDEQLKQVIRTGKGAMPAFGNLFSDADLAAIVKKVRRFDPTASKL